jgi:hypothetical protein
MTVFEGRDGAQYLPASSVQHVDGYADVTPRLLTDWRRAGTITAVTVAELAEALDRTVPAGVDGAQAARWPGPSGPEYVYRWSDVVRAETATRMTRRRRGGRPRSAPAA